MTVKEPEFTRADPRRPARTLSFRRIPELGGRWLRVVHEVDDGEPTVVTAYVDRDAEKWR